MTYSEASRGYKRWKLAALFFIAVITASLFFSGWLQVVFYTIGTSGTWVSLLRVYFLLGCREGTSEYAVTLEPGQSIALFSQPFVLQPKDTTKGTNNE